MKRLFVLMACLLVISPMASAGIVEDVEALFFGTPIPTPAPQSQVRAIDQSDALQKWNLNVIGNATVTIDGDNIHIAYDASTKNILVDVGTVGNGGIRSLWGGTPQKQSGVYDLSYARDLQVPEGTPIYVRVVSNSVEDAL